MINTIKEYANATQNMFHLFTKDTEKLQQTLYDEFPLVYWFNDSAGLINLTTKEQKYISILDFGQLLLPNAVYVIECLQETHSNKLTMRNISSSQKHKSSTIILLNPAFIPAYPSKELHLSTPNTTEILAIASLLMTEDTLNHFVSHPILVRSLLGLSSTHIKVTMKRILNKYQYIGLEHLRTIQDAKSENTGILEYIRNTQVTLGGMFNFKQWLKVANPARGVLLTGIPGTGKSMSARYIAETKQLPLYKLDVGRLFGSLVGDTERSVRELINTFKNLQEGVIWIDEIEKVLGVNARDSAIDNRLVGSLLTYLSDRTDKLFFVATANDVTRLPAELLRTGRFDKVIFVDLPTDSEREDILRLQYPNKNQNELDELVESTRDFTGAEICELSSNPTPISKLMPERINQLRNWAKERQIPLA